MTLVKRLCTYGLGLVVISIVFFIYIQSSFHEFESQVEASIEEVEEADTALVFGAGLRRNGTLSDALQDRVEASILLYNEQKVDRILMTGDNGSEYYDEVTAMKRYAVEQGVPEEHITLDYAGFDTYDSCYRARDIFSQTDVVAVSQEFHLPRILFICNKLGINTQGYVADTREYAYAYQFELREYGAKVKAWFEVIILKSEPKFLGEKVEVK